jgi:biotin transport system substrate-specific component
MQSFVVLMLGAMLGGRLAVAAVVFYLIQGALGLPVFANTPPAIPSPLYLLGPTGGFLAGFVVAAGLIGVAADRGLMAKPVVFMVLLLIAHSLLLLMGFAWLALFAQMSTGAVGLGFARAYQVGVEPFIIGTLVKVALAACLTPLLVKAASKFVLRG